MPDPADHPASQPVLPDLDETAVATDRLLATLARLTDDDLRAPSLLPGWTRGHVLTHVARNADALTNLVHWAATGEERPMYPSQEDRDAAIEAGADRLLAEQREDVARSADRFAEAARALPSDRHDAEVSRLPGGPRLPARLVGPWRRTEVEVHHADLGSGYTAADWPADYLDAMLARRERELAAAGTAVTLELTDRGTRTATSGPGGPLVSGATTDVVWWLLGRGTGERLACSEDRLPDLGRWV